MAVLLHFRVALLRRQEDGSFTVEPDVVDDMGDFPHGATQGLHRVTDLVTRNGPLDSRTVATSRNSPVPWWRWKLVASRIDWPASLNAKAFHGLAGEFVRLVSPSTEADEVALVA